MTQEETKAKPTVLIIEDEQFLCSLMLKKLESSGFTARGVFGGEEGLKAVEELKPEAILLDLLLPGIDGFEVIRRLKKDERFKKVPILVISNLGEPSDISKARELGALDYLIKTNYSPDEIVSKVWQALK